MTKKNLIGIALIIAGIFVAGCVLFVLGIIDFGWASVILGGLALLAILSAASNWLKK